MLESMLICFTLLGVVYFCEVLKFLRIRFDQMSKDFLFDLVKIKKHG